MRAPRKYVAALAFLALSLSYCFGQGYDPSYFYGAVPFQTHLQGQESINLSNGNLHFQIPIVSLPGRDGHDFVYSLSYNSQIWWGRTYVDGAGNTHYFWVDNENWTDSIPRFTFGDIVPPPNDGGQDTCHGNYRVSLPDGRELFFPIYTGCYDNVHQVNVPQFDQTSGSSVDPNSPRGGGCVRDFAYMSWGPTPRVVLENGDTFVLSSNQLTTQHKDANGNTITYSFPGDGSANFIDTVGRTIHLDTSGGAKTITYQDSNGVSQTVTLAYTPKTINPHFHWYAGTDPGPLTRSLLSSITYPNGDRYDFQYNGYFELAKIIYPTGGYTRYDYDFAVVNPSGLDVREVVGKHVCRDPNSRAHVDQNGLPGSCVSVPEDDTVIAPTVVWNSPPQNSATQVTSPNGDKTTYAFSWADQIGAFETQRKFYPAGSTTPLRTIDTTNSSNCGVPAQQKVTLDDNSVSMIQWGHGDSSNVYAYQTTFSGTTTNVTSKKEYAYGAGQAGSLVRQTATSFLHVNPVNSNDYGSTAIHILNRKASEAVSDVNNNTLAQATYEYDNYATAMQSSGTVQHDAAYLATANPLITTRGNLTATKRLLNPGNTWLSTTNTYDDAGNVLTTKDPKTNTTTFSYADSWNNSTCAPGSGNAAAYVTKITNALSQFSTRKYNSCSGTVGSSTDPNSQTTTFSYDAVGRPTVVSYPDGGQVSHCYSDGGSGCTASNPQLSETTTTAATGTLNIVTQTLVDGIGQVVTSTLQSDPDGATSTDTVYDGVGRVLKKSNPHRSGTLPTDGWTQFTYDALNRVTVVQQPDSSQVLTSYTGTQTTVTDEAGQQRTSRTDALGRLVAVWEDPGSAPHANYETDYQYDLLDNLVCAAQKGTNTGSFTNCASTPSTWRPRTFQYDSLSRLTSATNPESGTITYSYDNNGNLTTKTAPPPNNGTNSVITTYNYDVLNRLTGKTYSGMTMPTLQYFYDGTTPTGCTPTPPALTDSYKVGRRTSMCDGSGATSWSHDKMGRVLGQSQVQTISGGTNITKSASYAYNLDGSLKTLVYPSLNVVNYTIGGAGRVTQVNDSSNNYVGYSGNSATYTPGGAPVAMTNGQTGSFAGIATSNSYNSRLQPAVLSVNNPTQTIFNLSYNFNPGHDNGNVQQIANGLDSTRSTAYTYDSLNRIHQANTTTTNVPNCWGEAYSIDPWGNLTNISGPTNPNMPGCNTEPLSVAVNSNNQVVGWCYDAAGNLLDMGGCVSQSHSFVYDAEGHLQSPPVVGVTNLAYTYYYDGDDNRVQKCNANPCSSGSTVGTLYWMGAGGEVLDESGRTGTIQEEYIYFNGERIARRDVATGNVHYYFSNHLGSASLIADGSSGNVQQQTDYYPYGGIAYSSGVDTNRYKFNGKERDAESGLDNFGARYFASPIGRWMSPDSVNLTDDRVLNPVNTLNKYGYGGNNPLEYVDPDGRDITVFYDQSGIAGHIVLLAYDQQTGDSAVKSFGPANHGTASRAEELLSIPVPGKDNYGFENITSADQLRQQYASLTIQTSPGETQQAIQYIRTHPGGKYVTLGNNCTTTCTVILRKLRLYSYAPVSPNAFFTTLADQYSKHSQFHWPNNVPQNGVDYGNRRPGYNQFDLLLTAIQRQQEHVTHKLCWTDENGKTVCQ